MEFYELLEKRSSVRRYKDKPVEKEKLDRIIKAVMSAPSAGNLQAYHVLVIHDEDKRNALADAALGQRFIREAPVALVFSAVASRTVRKYKKRGEELYSIQDATIATTFALLAAVEEGLGSCWTGAFDTNEVRRVSGLPKGHLPIAILPIGYPARAPGKTSRAPMDEMVLFDDDG